MKYIASKEVINRKLAEFEGGRSYFDSQRYKTTYTESIDACTPLLEKLSGYWGMNIWKDEEGSYYCRLDHMTKETPHKYFIVKKCKSSSLALATAIYNVLMEIENGKE